jgi:integrase
MTGFRSSALPKLPFAATAQEWLRANRLTLSHSYEQTARAIVERHLVPFFGDRDLRALRRSDAAAFAEWMLERELSLSSIQNALSLARRIANACIEEERLERNPFASPGRLLRGLRRRLSPEVERVQAFRLDELEALLAEARRPLFAWLYPLLLFLISTGARRGEAIALRWEDVDLARGVVAIRRSCVRGREGLPKSGREREIPLGAASPRLRELLVEIARERAPNPAARVFLSPSGLELQERNLARSWYRLRRAAGVRPLRLHDLRHTFASRAIEAGVSIPRVSAWLGHAQIETTLRVYTHCVQPEREPGGFLPLEGGPIG